MCVVALSVVDILKLIMAYSQELSGPSTGNEMAVNRVQNESFLGIFLSLFPPQLQPTVRDIVMFAQDLFRSRPRVIECPFSESSIILKKDVNHTGRTIISKNGDVKVVVPEGAIKVGDSVTFHIATNPYGPFVLSTKGNLVTPYYWIGVSESYNFRKQVQIDFEHFAAPSHFATLAKCDSLRFTAIDKYDSSCFQLLSCEDDDKSYTMRPVDCSLGVKSQGDRSFFTYNTRNLCSYCVLYKHGEDPVINRISVFCLKQRNYQYLDDFRVEIWFSFPNGSCKKRNEELYTKKGMILDDDCSHIFEASCDANSKGYFRFDYIKNLNGWFLSHSMSEKIQTRKINFYNNCTDEEDLRTCEEHSLYPPRFVFHVKKTPECTSDLDTDIKITLTDENECKTFKHFKLSVPQVLCNDCCLEKQFKVGSCLENENVIGLASRPEYRKLMNYFKKSTRQ